MILEQIKSHLVQNAEHVFGQEVDQKLIQFQQTRKEFEGDITMVIFPFVKMLKKSPEQVGEHIGVILEREFQDVVGFNVVKGFLNISISDSYWLAQLGDMVKDNQFGYAKQPSGKTYMVEFSSPNTNKPLHLGHLRNIFLGDSLSSILQANGHEVIRTQIINDRGIHICKSMLAWERYAPTDTHGEKETPESAGVKGDKFVGKYYVIYDSKLGEEALELAQTWRSSNYDGVEEELATKVEGLLSKLSESDLDEKIIKSLKGKIKGEVGPYTSLNADAKEMLVKWEAGDETVNELWKTMNSWFYAGVDVTYNKMGVSFDKLYYESDTYILGKDHVMAGLEKGIFFKKEDGSVWIDLSDEGLDEKLVLRGDGTAVYMTQDIGTAIERFNDYPNLNGITYTVGNEQDYHFKVLFLILKKLGFTWAEECYHLSYGMIDLPKGMGRMKSREGTVVEADELMDEVISEARSMTMEKGHIEGMSDLEKDELCETIGLGGLKYFLLKVDPKKRMTFDPTQSVELQGNTGPFVQYAYARINSLLSNIEVLPQVPQGVEMDVKEKDLIKLVAQFADVVCEAGKENSPALIANYVYELAKAFNQFYHDFRILGEEDTQKRDYRILICKAVGENIKNAMALLGVRVPERM